MHTYIHTYIIHAYIHTYVVHIYIHTHTHIHTYVHMYVLTYVYIYIYTYTHSWIKAYAGVSGNELADKLAKEASGKREIPIGYNRIPKSVIKKDLEDTNVEIWQREWDTTNKGRITKDYFPKVAETLHANIHLTQNFTAMITGHRNIKAYLHRFKIIEAPNCPYGHDNQTAEHILLECTILKEERERLIVAVAKADNWPINKEMFIKKHYKAFAKFTKQIKSKK